jgi:hypothetical protein
MDRIRRHYFKSNKPKHRKISTACFLSSMKAKKQSNKVGRVGGAIDRGRLDFHISMERTH